MKLGEHESRGGHEISLQSGGVPTRVCLYEEYVAATHHLRKDMGRISDFWSYLGVGGTQEAKLVGGTITRVLPGNFSCEVMPASTYSTVLLPYCTYPTLSIPASTHPTFLLP